MTKAVEAHQFCGEGVIPDSHRNIDQVYRCDDRGQSLKSQRAPVGCAAPATKPPGKHQLSNQWHDCQNPRPDPACTLQEPVVSALPL